MQLVWRNKRKWEKAKKESEGRETYINKGDNTIPNIQECSREMKPTAAASWLWLLHA